MAANKERRYVSVKKQTYEKLQTYCKENGMTIGSFVESLCLSYLRGCPLEKEQKRKQSQEQDQKAPAGQRIKGIDKAPKKIEPSETEPIFSEEELPPWLR